MLVALEGEKGSEAKGAEIFGQICASCHAFGARRGGQIGPDLAVVKDRSAPYLVTHILDPNRAVEDRYMMYAATLLDGRSLAGMLVTEAGNSLTLRGLDGVEHVILRNELRLLVSSGRSLMPEGLEAALTPATMADLIAFLAGGSGGAVRPAVATLAALAPLTAGPSWQTSPRASVLLVGGAMMNGAHFSDPTLATMREHFGGCKRVALVLHASHPSERDAMEKR
eukprot:gene57019-78133_t